MNDPNTAEWITAGASIFAAVGTVAAVIVALWQSMRRDQVSLTISYESFRGRLSARVANNGPRPVTIAAIRLVDKDFERPLLKGGVYALTDDYLVPLNEGELVRVGVRFSSNVSLVNDKEPPTQDEINASPDPIWLEIEDGYGHKHRKLLPDVTVKRRGFRRRKTYVAEGRTQHLPSQSSSPFA